MQNKENQLNIHLEIDELLRADSDDLDLAGRLGVLVALQPHELDPHRHALLVVAVQVVDLVLQSGLSD